MKKTKIELQIPIFGSYFVCFIGYDILSFVKARTISRLYKGKRDIVELVETLNKAQGLTIRAMPENYYAVWISKECKGTRFHNTMAHELTHVVYGVLRDSGIELSKETGEVYAYLQGWLTEKVYDKLA